MDKNCLNCKYEPDWGEVQNIQSEYARRFGKCNWEGKLPILPAVYSLGRPHEVVRYGDDSGIETHCQTWEPKKKKVPDEN